MEFDFSSNTSVADLATIPPDFQGLYKKGDDGKFALDSDNPGVKSAVAAVTRLNQALKASRAEAKAKKVDLTPLSEYGDSPEKILEAFNVRISELNESLKKKGGEDLQRQVEKIKQELAGAHARDLQGRDARITALTGQLHSILVDNEAKTALAEAGVIDAELALPFLRQQVSVKEENGKFTVNVLDAAKDTRYSGVTGAPMTIKELVSEMKANAKYGPLFKSEAPTGGGKGPGSGPNQRQVNTSKDTSQLSAIDKISQGLSKGLAGRASRNG